MTKKGNTKYESPEVRSKVTVCEPVETGCCLRSCGGSPHHMEREALISKDTKAKFDGIINQKG